MYRGKYGTRNGKKVNKKARILLVSVLLILGIGIGATAAYLMNHTGSVTNTFTPAKVDVEVEERFEDNVKTNIGAKNTSNVKAYVRITLVEYWMKGNDIVAKPEGGDVDKAEHNDGWIVKDGIYYYTQPLAPNTSAPAALDEVTVTIPDGYTYHLDVHAEAIQAEPTTAVSEAWDVTLDGTTITGVN